jgi:glucokinase
MGPAHLLAEIADEIAMWVVNVALVIDPERVVIGGGFLGWGPTLFERLGAVAEHCMPFAPELASAHFGTDSALVGAGASALALVGAPGVPNEARAAN